MPVKNTTTPAPRLTHFREEAAYHPELMARIRRTVYDYIQRIATLYLEDGHCASMPGAIALCERIDPAVKTVVTYSGERLDTVYQRRNGEWVVLQLGAHVHPHPAA